MTKPFKSSWVDSFNRMVGKLPIRAWTFFVVFVIILIAGQLLFLWIDRGIQKVELLPVIVFNGFIAPFLLGLIYHLDNQAATALDSMEPVMNTTAEEFWQLKYMISNMPSQPSFIAGIALLVVVILLENIGTVPVRYAALEELALFNIVFQIVDKSSAFLFGVFFYHTVRQLQLVNTINLKFVRINLFTLGPLQAFSRLTASTAVGLLVGFYGWMLINPDLLSDPITFGIVGFITVLAVVVFVLPLFGVHRLLKAEKDRLLREMDHDFQEVFSVFNQAFDDDDYAVIERLNGTISSLDIQQKRIKEIPTWPWRPETAQFVFAAIAIPMVLAIIQFFVEQALGF